MKYAIIDLKHFDIEGTVTTKIRLDYLTYYLTYLKCDFTITGIRIETYQDEVNIE